MIVADASVLFALLVPGFDTASVTRCRLVGEVLAAPDFARVEVLSVLRRDTDETPVDLAIAWWTNGEIMNADLDDNGEVGVGDLLTMFEQWGTCSDGCDADLDGNGVLDLEDLLALIERWGA